jgi:alkylation response protein AidB-like acyl-CoA dehydrogenase
MHLFAVWTMQRLHQSVQAGADGPPLPVLEGLMKGVVSGGVVAAVTGTEAGTTIRYPRAEVSKTDDGYVFNAHKIFGTLSPFATILFASARLADDHGGYESVLAMVGKGQEGVELKDNWDAMGMRASGSGDVVYTNVRLPAGNVIRSGLPLGSGGIGPAAEPGTGNLGLLGAFTGIAEAAAQIVIDAAKTRRKGPSDRIMAERPWMQHLIGEMTIDLQTCRSLIAHMGRYIDALVEAYPRRDLPEDVMREGESLHQVTKYVVNRKAIDVVDRALTASGGAGYMAKHPLSRLYRDVRAGPFMQPYSPPEAVEVVGRIALGQELSDEL